MAAQTAGLLSTIVKKKKKKKKIYKQDFSKGAQTWALRDLG